MALRNHESKSEAFVCVGVRYRSSTVKLGAEAVKLSNSHNRLGYFPMKQYRVCGLATVPRNLNAALSGGRLWTLYINVPW